MKYLWIFFWFNFSVLLWAQQDSVVYLEDLVVPDFRISKNKTQWVQSLNDSALQANKPLLTELLNYNTPIYFKENGYGMVSSPSFRGTTASQTSVLWNGIKLNSGFLGQADFNTISSQSYDEIEVKPGGGSVVYGSGALGGCIHLNNKLDFNQDSNSVVQFGYGSFETYNALIKTENSFKNLSYQLSVDFLKSENDFEVDEFNYTNINGQFQQITANANLAYRWNSRNTLSLFSQFHTDDRHFSLADPSSNKTRYKNFNYRSLLQWENQWNKLYSNAKVAFLQEEFLYFQEIDGNYFSKGQLNTILSKYDGTYQFNSKMALAFLGEFQYASAVGDNTGISNEKQNSGNLALLWTHQIFQPLYYEVGVRQEFNEDYISPFLYSAGLVFQPFKFYEIKFNISKNFRAPTFNDLYWEPGGNTELKSENGEQYELNQTLKWFKNKIGVNLYYHYITDMLRWVPGSLGYWEPINTDKVLTKGIETFVELNKNWGSHNLQLAGSYAYTIATNLQTHTQLTYVPFQKLNGTLAYGNKHFNWFAQGLLVGKAFTTTNQSNDYKVDEYIVFNTGVNINLLKNSFSLGFRLNNVFDRAYMPYPYRPNPGRNFNTQIRYKF